MKIKVERSKTIGQKFRPKDTELSFGKYTTDHMFLMDYTHDKGWHEARIVPYGPLYLDPTAMVLHYNQEIFEGLKAYAMDDEGIALMKSHGTYLVADIYVDDYIVAEYEKMGAPKHIIEKEKLVGRTQRENFKKAVEAGVKIAYGTDAAVYPHGGNAKQFRHMVQWGLTPMQAIQAATVSAADLLGWQDKVGSISPGKLADIVVLSRDIMTIPAEQILSTRVLYTIVGGKVRYRHKSL